MLTKYEELDPVEWLQIELNKRDWRQSNLTAKGGINSGLMSMIMNGLRKPGPKTLVKIADALGIPREIVFEKWGLLDESTDEKEQLLDQMRFNARGLTLSEIRAVTGYVAYLRQKKSSENNSEHS